MPKKYIVPLFFVYSKKSVTFASLMMIFAIERRQALGATNDRVFIFKNRCPVFLKVNGWSTTEAAPCSQFA